MSKDHRHWVISGGIGSGKSAVRRMLDEFGFHTVDADSVGHEVLAEGGAAVQQVASRWPEVVGEDGINRAELAAIVFSNNAELDVLERITHPHIFGTISKRIQGIPDPVAVEIPLLDHGLKGDWRRIIVDCEDEVRISRLMESGMKQDEVIRRMSVQPARSVWLAQADVVVPNHGTAEDLRTTVGRLVSDI